MESGRELKEILTSANGKTQRRMAMECTSGRTEIGMKVSGERA